ncbi:MAG: SMC-Scp complex subunit ScpB [Oleiphilaceae bacterium]|nr:SMC-Scp complex subunit ScpB [Oleiphilaceae bacterium]
MNEDSIQQLQRIIEAVLLASDRPLTVDQMLALFTEDEPPTRQVLEHVLSRITQDCEGRGFELRRVASGYRFQVRESMAPWVGRLWEEKPQRYSRALLETLALIAYRQPITRGDIEDIRGVTVSSNIIRTLLDREWVRVVGHKDVPGRPALYATCKPFLDYFNLESLEQLPPLAEVRDLGAISQEVEDRLQAELSLDSDSDEAAESHELALSGQNELNEPRDTAADNSGQTHH